MQKQRVSRACDSCKRRKIRCTGTFPCARCVKHNKTCEFKAPYTRGALPKIRSVAVEKQEEDNRGVDDSEQPGWGSTISINSSNQMQERGADHGDQEQQHGQVRYDQPNGTDRHYLASSNLRKKSSGTLSSRAQGTQSNVYSKATDATDYSYASLHKRTLLNKPKNHQKNPVTAYGDPPLPEIDTSFLVFPSQNEAQALLSMYFDLVSATVGFLHRPTIERWTSELLSEIRGMRTEVSENSQRAVVLMVFASTFKYMHEAWTEDNGNADAGFLYFQAAESQLSKETGEIRLATLQARLLQCGYLLSRGRINQCYSTFGSIATFIYTLGIHREQHHSSNNSDFLELEIRKRVFWSAYVIDKYLSSSLGRPEMFRDEDIDQQLPHLLEDENLPPSLLQKTSEHPQNSVDGVLFQIRLSKIMSRIIRELYSARKIPLENRLASAEGLLISLCNWRSEVAHFLDVDPVSLPSLYRSQNGSLRLSYSCALILLHRPFLLDNFDDYLASADPLLRAKIEDNVSGCLNAALDVFKTIDAMHEVEKSFNASWFSHYCAYTAIVAVIVHVIKHLVPDQEDESSCISTKDEHPNPPAWRLYFDAATKCQDQIRDSSAVAKESFAQKCSIVLEELRAEALHKIQNVYSKEKGDWPSRRSAEAEQHPKPPTRMEEVTQAPRSESPQPQTAGEDFLVGIWNNTSDDQSVYQHGFYPISNGLNGLRDPNGSSLVDKIDRWGFSSLTGY